MSQKFAPKEQPTRKITVYNTSGTCQTSFDSTAKTFGQLKKELAVQGVNYEGMKVVVGENQNELKRDEDLLTEESVIEQELTLFLTPIRVKSGEVV